MERTLNRPLTGRASTIRLGVAALAIGVIVAACGTGGATTAPTTAVTNPPATTTPSVASTPAPSTGGSAAIELELEDASVGDYVAGENGLALYIFTPDAAAPGKSVCNGECATNWPPLVVDDLADVSAGEGITGELGTVTRDDGTTQVTLGGNPLYYFKGDAAAGDTNGQALNNVWWLAGADGKGIGAPATSIGRDY